MEILEERKDCGRATQSHEVFFSFFKNDKNCGYKYIGELKPSQPSREHCTHHGRSSTGWTYAG